MICAPDGGVLDDLIVYRLADTEFLVVANAANTAVVAAALRERAAGYPAQVDDKTGDYALIAIQGPHASPHPAAAHRYRARPGALLRRPAGRGGRA